jgi:hypothetical protein
MELDFHHGAILPASARRQADILPASKTLHDRSGRAIVPKADKRLEVLAFDLVRFVEKQFFERGVPEAYASPRVGAG